MPRDLKAAESEKNVMIFMDQLSGSRLTLFYKAPTTTDRINYKSAIVKVALKSKDEKEIFDVQLNWADKFITGFAEGDFTLGDKPISTDKESENFYDGWRQVLRDGAADIMFNFTETLFGAPNYVVKNNGAEPDFS